MGDLVEKTVEVANLYHDCRARHQALIDWITN